MLDLKCVKGEELFIESKIKEDNKLVSDRKKIIDRNDASDVYHNE
ncbi:2976_t:CDS:2, partial [Gigaspora margarita]